jgi:putative redox protein|tara:strand:+ start:6002 stop:6592 length:591 start_codon:yes stop_codon:yes gene_type:complete
MATRLLVRPLRATAKRFTARAASTTVSSSSGDGDEKHLKRYPLIARGAGVQCVMKARSFDVKTDIPKAMGGLDEAPQPVELLLSALVGCEQATAAYVARHMVPRFKLNRVNFAITGVRDDRGSTSLPMNESPKYQARLLKITGEAVVHVRGATENQARVDELARLVMSRCPVADTLNAAGTKMEVKWRIADEFNGD